MRRRAASHHASGLFITGTDTGVGKTLVTAALGAICREAGVDVGVMKPIATGGIRQREGMRQRLASPDCVFVANTLGIRDPWSLMNPVCYREPLAPYTAARRQRQAVSWPLVTNAFRALRRRHRFLLVEGIGGLAVPLSRRRTVVDLIRRLDLPVVVVARLRLGTLNHTLLTIEHARRHGLRVLGVVLNAVEPPSADPAARLAERTNPASLEACLPVPLLGCLPHRPRMHSARALADWARTGLNPKFLNWLRRHPVDSPTALC